MNRRLLFIALFLMNILGGWAQVGELPRAIPEDEGVPSEAVTLLFDSLTALPKTDIHSVMILRHGKVIGEIHPAPFAPEYAHTLYSCSKTFVGVAVGLAIADNRLRLDDRVATFFPELLPDSVSDNLASMTVRHLLTMTSGIKPDWGLRSKTRHWVRAFLSKEVQMPGRDFAYDSLSTYLLSAIVQRATGMTLLDYLKLKIFHPMHITEVAWEVSPEGYNTGGWGLYLQTESLAKFGQLLLNRGCWNGQQLVPAAWLDEMTRCQVKTGREDYGYQTWLCDYPGAVRADGALGQYIIVVPEKDMVVVMTESTLTNGRRQRTLVWELLLPNVQDQPLPVGKAYRKLQKQQPLYKLPFAEGKAKSSASLRYAGRTIKLSENTLGWKTLRLHFEPKQVVMTVTDAKGEEYDLHFGYKEWQRATITAHPPYSIQPIDAFKGIEGLFHVAGSYAWPTSDTLCLKAHYVDWVSALELRLAGRGADVEVQVIPNYAHRAINIQGELQ